MTLLADHTLQLLAVKDRADERVTPCALLRARPCQTPSAKPHELAAAGAAAKNANNAFKVMMTRQRGDRQAPPVVAGPSSL